MNEAQQFHSVEKLIKIYKNKGSIYLLKPQLFIWSHMREIVFVFSSLNLGHHLRIGYAESNYFWLSGLFSQRINLCSLWEGIQSSKIKLNNDKFFGEYPPTCLVFLLIDQRKVTYFLYNIHVCILPFSTKGVNLSCHGFLCFILIPLFLRAWCYLWAF